MNTDTWLRPDELAQILDVHKVTLANWRRKGRGPAFVRLGADGREVRYLRADVDAWLESNRVEMEIGK